MSRAGFLQTWCLELRFSTVWESFSFFCIFQVGFHVSSLRRDWVWPHRHKSPDRCSVHCLSHLYTVYDHGAQLEWPSALAHYSNQGPSPSICSVWPAIWRVMIVPNFFHLRIMEATCFCEPSMQRNYFWTFPQMCVLTQSCLWALQAVILTSGLSFFCLDMYF